MTREELKQKAINRIKETTPVLKDRSDIEIIAMCHVRVEDYIAGAEPREKRIAELEATNKRISDECHNLVNSLEKKQNEIVALKAQIEKMKCCSNCKHSRTVYEHCRTNKHEKWEIKEE